MPIQRAKLYKFPWSKSDNPGSWVEVTDACDLDCLGCYRHRLEGHRPVEDIKSDILSCQKLTNCSRVSIAGGEPLIYPHIVEVVDFISRNKMQPVIFTNGEKLSRELLRELKKAGVFQIFVHVDSSQRRPGWEGKSEAELNPLRQHYADLIAETGGVQCGFNMTVTRKTLPEVPAVVEWVRKNISKVQNVSLIALRGMVLAEDRRYMVNGKEIDLSVWACGSPNERDLDMTSGEILEVVEQGFPGSTPSAFLSGTAWPQTYKFLIILYVGTPRRIFGTVGAKAIELNEILTHLRQGRYYASIRNPQVGKKVFFLSLIDRELRKAWLRFLGASLRDPRHLFDPVYIQCINIQQPNEILDGEVNLCDGCLNMMMHKGELIPSCQLDGYRLYGGIIREVRRRA